MPSIILFLILILSKPVFCSPFGLTGEYNGSLSFNNKLLQARLMVVEHKDVLRGIIVVPDLTYEDENGEVWEGASFFIKGDRKTGYFLSGYKCSFLADICGSTPYFSEYFYLNRLPKSFI